MTNATVCARLGNIQHKLGRYTAQVIDMFNELEIGFLSFGYSLHLSDCLFDYISGLYNVGIYCEVENVRGSKG